MTEKEIKFSKRITQILNGCRFKGCLFPDKQGCSKKVIKAHSVQKSKILNRIADKGIIITYVPRKSTITLDFEEVGINTASTFFGFCNTHDTKIFSPIENQDYKASSEQNFLFAYRACAREYVVCFESACMLQNLASQYRSFPNWIPKLFYALEGKKQSIKDFQGHMDEFNKIIIKEKTERDYDIISSTVFKLPFESLIAVNSSFNLIYDFDGEIISDMTDLSKKPATLFLNIFPQKKITHILLSCFTADISKYKKVFSKIKSFSISELEFFFTQIILVHCENLFLSPNKWHRLPKIKRNQVVQFFKDVIRKPLPNNYISIKPPINLFKLLKEETTELNNID